MTGSRYISGVVIPKLVAERTHAQGETQSGPSFQLLTVRCSVRLRCNDYVLLGVLIARRLIIHRRTCTRVNKRQTISLCGRAIHLAYARQLAYACMGCVAPIDNVRTVPSPRGIRWRRGRGHAVPAAGSAEGHPAEVRQGINQTRTLCKCRYIAFRPSTEGSIQHHHHHATSSSGSSGSNSSNILVLYDTSCRVCGMTGGHGISLIIIGNTAKT